MQKSSVHWANYDIWLCQHDRINTESYTCSCWKNKLSHRKDIRVSQIIVRVFIKGLISTTLSSPAYSDLPKKCTGSFRKSVWLSSLFITEHKANHRKLPSQGSFCLSMLGWGGGRGRVSGCGGTVNIINNCQFHFSFFFFASFFFIMHIANLYLQFCCSASNFNLSTQSTPSWFTVL